MWNEGSCSECGYQSLMHKETGNIVCLRNYMSLIEPESRTHGCCNTNVSQEEFDQLNSIWQQSEGYPVE